MIGASLEQNGGIATLEKLLLRHAPNGIEIEHVSSHDEGSVLHRIVVFSKAWFRVVERCMRNKIDLVHVHVSDGGSVIRKVIISLTAFLFRKPVLMHANGAEFHLTYDEMPRWMQSLTRKTFCRCAVFAAVTNQWKDYYLNQIGLDKNKVVLLPNPTELPEKIPDRSDAKVVKLAFCGRIGARKGAFDLLHAVANLPDLSKHSMQLVLAGDGQVEKAKQLAADLGWVDRNQIQSLLEQANVFLLPSYNEGLPLALMEAMGWALPVITTPVSGIPDVVKSESNGILVNPGDIAGLTRALHLLITDDCKRLAMGAAARKTVEPLDVRVQYGRLCQIYESMIQPN
jgi:glycosyltransferase involved in cell wall biosynthesis